MAGSGVKEEKLLDEYQRLHQEIQTLRQRWSQSNQPAVKHNLWRQIGILERRIGFIQEELGY